MPENLEEVLIRLPKSLYLEVNGIAQNENKDFNELIYQATKNYVQYKKELNQFHEMMQKGYIEMAKINLHLCSEAFLAEEEAKNTLDRLVIGV